MFLQMQVRPEMWEPFGPLPRELMPFMPFAPIAIAFAALIILFLMIGVPILLVTWLRSRAANRERVATAALAAGQPEMAIYVLQGPRRLLAFLVLVVSLCFVFVGIVDSEAGIFLFGAVIAVVSAIVLLKRPFSKRPLWLQGQGTPPAGATGAQTGPWSAPVAPVSPDAATQAGCPPPHGAPTPVSAQRAAQEPPREHAARPAAPAPAYAASPASRDSLGFLEIALIVVAVILALFAGLVLIRVAPVLIFLLALAVILFYAMDARRRSRVYGSVGSGLTSASAWLQARAAMNGHGPQPPYGGAGMPPAAPMGQPAAAEAAGPTEEAEQAGPGSPAAPAGEQRDVTMPPP